LGMELEIIERADDVTLVALVGKLDVNGLRRVDVKFQAVTAAQGRPALVDISRLEYIASLGIGMLISSAQALQRKGHQMILVGARATVDTALRTSGIDQAITMVGDVDDALRVLGRA